MPNFYATFGASTGHGDRYQVVDAPDNTAARELMFKTYGTKWAFIYDEEDFAECISRWGLKPLPVVLGGNDD